jgi:hypothetical protein
VGCFGKLLKNGSLARQRGQSGFQRAFGVRGLAGDGKRHQSLASSFVSIRAESWCERTCDTGHCDKAVAGCQLSVRKVLGLKALVASVVPGGLPIHNHAYPPLKRWAIFCRPARQDWIVVGAGSIDVSGSARAPIPLCSRPALSLRDKISAPAYALSSLVRIVNS